MKRILFALLFSSIALTLVGCQKNVTLQINDNAFITTVNEELTVTVNTDDEKGLTIEITDEAIVKHIKTNKDGIVFEGLKEGETTVKVISKSNDSVVKEFKITVRKKITISSITDEIEVMATSSIEIDVQSNDDSLTYTSSDKEIFVMEDSTLVAKRAGTATLFVTSTYDDSVSLEITVIVLEEVIITPNFSEYSLVVGDSVDVLYQANDDCIIESRNPNFFSVDGTKLTALSYGQGVLRIKSVSQPSVYVDVIVNVFKETNAITITGNQNLIVGMEIELTIDPDPLGGFEGVTWESTDTTVLTVDEQGVVKGVGVGYAQVIATSTIDSSIKDTFDIEVKDVLVVDYTATSGSTFDFEGVDLEFDSKLFTTINDALSHANPYSMIYIASGTYDEDITLDIEGVSLIGLENAFLDSSVLVNEDFITIQNISFINQSTIRNTVDVTALTIDGNTTSNLSLSEPFIALDGVNGLEVINNTFDSNVDVLSINDFLDGTILIKDNEFLNSKTAIRITADREYSITTEIKILWNNISNVSNAFEINLLDESNADKDIIAYARFNTVSYTVKAVDIYVDNTFDFTLNYWGSEEPVLSDFINVDSFYLRGYYSDIDSVMKEENYDVRIPILIEIVNPISEIMIGESYQITYRVLPMDMVNPNIRFITSNPSLLSVSNDGVLTPNVSGEAMITVRSGYNSKINTTMDVTINTTPGVELSVDHIMNDLLVGDSFTLTANCFPSSSSAEPITFTSSNQDIATINQSGYVSLVGVGTVTLKATMTNDVSVYTEYTVTVYDELNTASLLDYLTTKQVSYSTPHEWVAYGYQGNYNDKRYESVSRYYFDEIVINDSKLVPVFYAIRPGEPMNTLPEDVRYNEDNIHWVVVHDTASSANGSNALAHANYLFNNTANQNELWVSWHYTIDDTYVYQHLPENERAFHAGDGSTPVGGSATYLGGGNRNGVGIEMAINQDGDMYRTWQRTAKLVVDILLRNNLPTSQQRYHNDFSGKDCPRTLRNAGLIPLFEEFVEIEYYVKTNHPTAQISMTSNDPLYVDNYGRVIQMPDRAMTVSYTITVFENGVTESRTFYTYLPGTVH